VVIVNEASYSGLNREEKDGIYVCHPSSIGKTLFINEFVHDVFSQCNKKSVNEIVKTQQNRYSTVAKNIIETDTVNTIWYLHNIGIVTLTGEDRVVMETAELTFSLLSEKDFENASKLIYEKYEDQSEYSLLYFDYDKNISSLKDIESLYRLPILRLSHVNGGIIYFKYSNEGSRQIDSLCGLKFLLNNMVAYIDMIVSDIENIDGFFNQLTSELDFQCFKWLKIRLVQDDLRNNASGAIPFLTKRFVKEAELKNETLEGRDVTVYAYKLGGDN
jgi:hypothetical protein